MKRRPIQTTSHRRRIAQSSAIAALAALCYFAGQLSAAQVEAQRDASIYERLSLFAEVLGHIRTQYVEPIPDDTLVEGAIRGMIGELDPHSTYLDAEEYAAMRRDTRGQYVGVGMEIRALGDRIVVTGVFDGGPAADAGVREEDRLVRVDGESVYDWTVEEVVRALRGERGTAVFVQVERPSDGSSLVTVEFELVRDVIYVDAVDAQLKDRGIGYLRLRSFQAGSADEVRDAIDELESSNDGELAGLILDLRNNPGGLLSEGISVADVFLDQGTIVTTRGRAESERDEYAARRPGTRFSAPLIVLINGASASASEIVAGALQDHGRAVLMGTKSFGKGSVQSMFDLSDGSGVKLTVARYYTPSGRSIHETGIEPDFVVEARPEEESEEEPVDRQLEAALRQLHAFDVFRRSGTR